MKREAAITAFLAGAALSIFAAEPAHNPDWKAGKQSDGVVIYSRPHGGSTLKEFKAVGEIDATAETVHKVIDDVEGYRRFRPYTAVSSGNVTLHPFNSGAAVILRACPERSAASRTGDISKCF